MKRLADSPRNVNYIPQNEEKYVTFGKNILVDTIVKNEKEVNIYSMLKFVDTMKFMQTSLEKLVENLGKDKSKFKRMSKYFHDEDLNLILRKGVYPYEYMTDISKYREQSLPLKEIFNSRLDVVAVSNSDDKFKSSDMLPSEISDEDYQHAHTVFKTFNCKNLGDYTELYCKSDVLLLADVFENFIDVCLEKYKLDPSHYITAPSLSWDDMLKMTKVELELLTDGDMYLFFEEGIRGGVSTITNRYAKANNTCLISVFIY